MLPTPKPEKPLGHPAKDRRTVSRRGSATLLGLRDRVVVPDLKIKMNKRALILVGSLALLAAAYLFLALVGVVPAPFACSSETKQTLGNVSGMDFEITYTNCDTLAKEEFVSIYVSKTGESGGSLFGRLFSRRTLVFRYDPGMWNSPLPLITASGPNRVLISISRISSIMSQSKSWDNVTIDYVIGQVDYPRTDASGQKP
jgi:hypothetical protein